MSSWSLVLWRPPPSSSPPTDEEPVYSLNPHVAALLRNENRLPRSLPLVGALSPPRPREEDISVEDAPAAWEVEIAVEPMDVDTNPEPVTLLTEEAVIEAEAAPVLRTSPAEEAALPSEEDEASPGVRHQGMHKRPAAELVDIAKVLKRPFKSPARVVLRGAKRKADSTLPPLPSPNSSPALPTQTEWPHRLPPRLDSPSPSPVPRPRSTSSRARRVNAKFKAPGPSSDSDSRSSRRRRGPDADLIASLEQRIRVLKQASACEEDERVVALIQQWRAAGREVTERLFRMIPEPEVEMPKQRRSDWGWGWDETGFTTQLPQGCVEFIRDECVVKDGEIVDPDGVVLFQDEMELDDILPTGGGRAAVKRRPRIATDDDGAPAPLEVQSWNRGTMLNKLGVDPALLGYNIEKDDWDDIDDD